MKIELKPRLEQMVRDQIDAGAYPDAEAVVEDALALLQDHQAKLTNMRASLARARQDVANGLATEIHDRDQLLALFEER